MSKSKITSFILSLAAAVSAASGCGGTAPAQTDGGKLSIVCTIFPEYDWVKQIMGERADSAEITYLLESGIDLHNYQPSAEDIIRISDCDMFLYVGGESDEWAEDALENAANKDMLTVKLLEAVGTGAKLEEVKEGMQAEDEEEEGEAEDGEEEYDEHVWLSVRNAKMICAEIAEKLCEVDPDGAPTYKANLASYTVELDKLDAEFSEVTGAAPVKTLVFGDRFPFRYFADDYGLDYYAAFVGCSAETEASFETVIFLAEKVNELGCKTVYTIEGPDKSIAETIIGSTSTKDASVAELNSLQSVSRAQADSGVSYISLMREDLRVLEETLK